MKNFAQKLLPILIRAYIVKLSYSFLDGLTIIRYFVSPTPPPTPRSLLPSPLLPSSIKMSF